MLWADFCYVVPVVEELFQRKALITITMTVCVYMYIVSLCPSLKRDSKRFFLKKALMFAIYFRLWFLIFTSFFLDFR